MNPNVPARWLMKGVGALDFASGLGLALLPVFTLKAMGIAAPAAEALPFVRFVGAFVAAVGASCVWAGFGPAPRLHALLGATLFFRAGVALFTGVAVLACLLDRGWLLVTAADAALVALQSWLLSAGAGRET